MEWVKRTMELGAYEYTRHGNYFLSVQPEPECWVWHVAIGTPANHPIAWGRAASIDAAKLAAVTYVLEQYMAELNGELIFDLDAR